MEIKISLLPLLTLLGSVLLHAQQDGPRGYLLTPAGTAPPIKANDKVVAEGHVGRAVPFRFSTEETLDIGEDTGTPVDLPYDVPATFTGELGKVVFDLK